MFSNPTKLPWKESIPHFEAADQIQQIKSVGNQPRVGVLSPNVIADTNARAVSTPTHVQSVRVRVERASDVSSRVTVTFKRDPNDYFFSHALVHVSGYKGNPAPTQVGSGQSPIVFSLENTGDPVAVHVQANGNLGPAPLQTAPSAAMQLAKNTLVTTPTTSGTGITPQAITVIQAGMTGVSIMPRLPFISNVSSVSNGNKSIIWAIPAGSVAAATGRFKIKFQVAANTLIVNKTQIKRTLPNDTTIIDTTNITFGGALACSLTGSVTSDVINYIADTDHDYYIIMYFDPTNTTGTVYGAQPNSIYGCCAAVLGDATGSTIATLQAALVANAWYAITGIVTA